MEIRARFFRSSRELRDWFEAHRASDSEIWIGFYKAHTRRTGVTYGEAVEEAICFGWIDTTVRRIDDDRYANRFVTRRPGSHWTPGNQALFRELDRAGRIAPAGRAAFERDLPLAPKRGRNRTRDRSGSVPHAPNSKSGRSRGHRLPAVVK